MVSLKKNQSGFTIVELLIVIVIIGILAGLVISTFVGVQQKARNSERQTDINTISGQLEAYYAKNSGYPVLADVNNVAWRNANEVKVGDASKALADPSKPEALETGRVLVAAAAAGKYVYTTVPASCVSPTDNTGAATTTGTFCTGYTLTATYEDNKATHDTYVKNSAN
jgi:prepilin-type N-terminal cleavage/methylation domain-containing protein